MRQPRVPFTIRGTMVAVVGAILGGAIGLFRMGCRSESYRRKANWYAQGEMWNRGNIGRYATTDPQWDEVIQQKAAYCYAMRQKYERAAWRPWITVPLDPPYPWDAVTTERFGRARAEFLARMKHEQENTKPRQLEAGPP
jgi:hypothetical protein